MIMSAPGVSHLQLMSIELRYIRLFLAGRRITIEGYHEKGELAQLIVDYNRALYPWTVPAQQPPPPRPPTPNIPTSLADDASRREQPEAAEPIGLVLTNSQRSQSAAQLLNGLHRGRGQNNDVDDNESSSLSSAGLTQNDSAQTMNEGYLAYTYK